MRYLATFGAIVAALYLLVFFTGNRSPTPKLGIDLQGGTRVTLTARTPNGAPPSAESLKLARTIIENRVNGIGVAGSEVVTSGQNLVITVPGNDGGQAKSLGQTAQLYFRGVVNEVAATPPQAPATPAPTPVPGTAAPASPPTATPPTTTPPAVTTPAPAPTTAAPKPQGRVLPAQAPTTPVAPPTTPAAPPTSAAPPTTSVPAPIPGSAADKVAAEIAVAKAQRQSTDPAAQQQALAALDCTKPDVLAGNDDPTLPLITCGTDNQAKYILSPSFLKGSDISDAKASIAQGGVGFEVQLTFTSAGSDIWGKYTSANVGKQAAFVLDSRVVSAPRINSAITGGVTSITGRFSQPQAQDLANTLKYGSLPLSFDQSTAQTVSASLGLASLQAGLLAGGIGLILVLIYCLAYYRMLGILTALSLLLSGVVIYAVLVLLGRYIGSPWTCRASPDSSWPSASPPTPSWCSSNASKMKCVRAAASAPPYPGDGSALGAPSCPPTRSASSPPRCCTSWPSARFRGLLSPSACRPCWISSWSSWSPTRWWYWPPAHNSCPTPAASDWVECNR